MVKDTRKIRKELHEHTETDEEHVETTVEKARHAAHSAAEKTQKTVADTVEKTQEVAAAVAGKAKSESKKRIDSVTLQAKKTAGEVREHADTAKEHIASTVERARGAAHTAAERTQEFATDAALKTREVATVVVEKTRVEARTGVLKLQILDLRRKRKQMLIELGGRIYDLVQEKISEPYADVMVSESLANTKTCDEQIERAEKEIEHLAHGQSPETRGVDNTAKESLPGQPSPGAKSSRGKISRRTAVQAAPSSKRTATNAKRKRRVKDG
jgi:hypothetical protein